MHLMYRLAAGADTREAVSVQPGVVAACVSTLQSPYSVVTAVRAAGMLHAPEP